MQVKRYCCGVLVSSYSLNKKNVTIINRLDLISTEHQRKTNLYSINDIFKALPDHQKINTESIRYYASFFEPDFIGKRKQCFWTKEKASQIIDKIMSNLKLMTT